MFLVVVYRIHYLGSGRNRIRIFFQNQYPAGTGSGSFFQIKIRPEPDPDPKYFKFYVVSLKKELIKFNYYNTI